MAEAERPDPGFLSRWSERKLQTRRGALPPEAASEPLPEVEAEDLRVTKEASEPVLTDADMPPLESLDAHSDYSGFLSRGVSEALRRKALSKLFRSAHLNVTDGLDDYAEDFTKFAPLGDVVTADMRHRIEQAAKRLLKEGEESERLTVATPEESAEPERTREGASAVPDQDSIEGEAI